MSTRTLTVGILVVLVIVTGGILYIRSLNQNYIPPAEVEVQGTIKYISPEARIITATASEGKTLTLVVAENASFKDRDGALIALSDLSQGQDIAAKGRVVSDYSYIVTEINVRSKVSNSPNPGSSEIEISSPVENSFVKSPLEITGRAKGSWYFEASFPVSLIDANNKELARAPAQAQGEWMTAGYVPFKITLTFNKPTTETGFLVFENDNPSGDPTNQKRVAIPVRFDLKAATVSISLYYPNMSKVKNVGDECSPSIVVPVERQVSVSETPIKDAINLLILGNLTTKEISQGFETEFPNQGFKLLGANLKNGALTLEFTEVPGFTSGGSCRIGLLAAQITKTAKQFPGVKNVVFIPDQIFQP